MLHCDPSSVTASDDCADEGITPARASLQFRQPQFHCGNPPPADAPKTINFIPGMPVLPGRCDGRYDV